MKALSRPSEYQGTGQTDAPSAPLGARAERGLATERASESTTIRGGADTANCAGSRRHDAPSDDPLGNCVQTVNIIAPRAGRRANTTHRSKERRGVVVNVRRHAPHFRSRGENRRQLHRFRWIYHFKAMIRAYICADCGDELDLS